MGHDWQLFRSFLLKVSSESYTIEDNTAIRVVFYILYFNEPVLTSLQYTLQRANICSITLLIHQDNWFISCTKANKSIKNSDLLRLPDHFILLINYYILSAWISAFNVLQGLELRAHSLNLIWITTSTKTHWIN